MKKRVIDVAIRIGIVKREHRMNRSEERASRWCNPGYLLRVSVRYPGALSEHDAKMLHYLHIAEGGQP